MSASAAPVLIYGGTFDPVHEGHVAVAQSAADALGVGTVLLIPAADPPHRATPMAPAIDRAAMLRLAFALDARCVVDERELHRAGPSYSVDTMDALRAEYGPRRSLIMLLGADAYAGLPRWHQPHRLPPRVHLAVFARPGHDIDTAIGERIGWQRTSVPQALHEMPHGLLLPLPRVVSDLSSTDVRAALDRGERRPAGLPERVADHIAARGLYGNRST